MSILSGPASLLGIGKDHGDYYQNKSLENKGTQSLAEMLAAARGGGVSAAGNDLMGGKSLADVLKGLSGDEVSGLATSPVYGNMVASDQAASDPLLSGMLGKGGSRDQALAQEHDLATQGYKLQPQDVEAYGQASGNIARQFGQTEQSLASALSNRGLAAGGSGAAGAQFSGVQGNKNEQLAQMQTQIADARMNNTTKRLADTRSYINQASTLGLNAENSKFSNNMAGANSRTSLANDLSGAQHNDFQANEAARQASMTSQQGALKKNLGDALSAGVYKGVESGAQAGTSAATGNLMGMPTGAESGGVPGGSSAPANTGSVSSGGNGGFSAGRSIPGLYGR